MEENQKEQTTNTQYMTLVDKDGKEINKIIKNIKSKFTTGPNGLTGMTVDFSIDTDQYTVEYIRAEHFDIRLYLGKEVVFSKKEVFPHTEITSGFPLDDEIYGFLIYKGILYPPDVKIKIIVGGIEVFSSY